MKTIYKTSILMMMAMVMLCSCSKKNNPTPASNNISLLAGNWTVNQWGGVSGDVLIFTIDKTTAKGTVDAISGAGYGFAAGDIIFSDIKANSDGSYSTMASYSPTGSGLSTRSATMTLQNNNTQLTVYYPEINASFPAITYIFQATSETVINLN